LENIPITRRLAISYKKNSRWMETTDSETPNLVTSPKNPYNFPLTPKKTPQFCTEVLISEHPKQSERKRGYVWEMG
jgi:asparagine synthetase B (glutamine-hydrolysing)